MSDRILKKREELIANMRAKIEQFQKRNLDATDFENAIKDVQDGKYDYLWSPSAKEQEPAMRMALHKIESYPERYNYLLQTFSAEYIAHMIGVYGDRAVEMANDCVKEYAMSH